MKNKNRNRIKSRLVDFALAIVFVIGIILIGDYFVQVNQAKDASKQDSRVVSSVVTKKHSKSSVKKDKNDPGNININWKSLKKQNPDVIAWIYIPGTKINYPILQGKDNEYYLHHNLSGDKSDYGEVFMDYRQSPDLANYNTFLYAHNMYDETKFAELNNYFNTSFYKNHQNVYVYTPKSRFDGKVFAVQSNKGESKAHTMDFDNNSQFSSYVNYLKQRSSISTNIKSNSVKKLLTLWTCTMQPATDDNGNQVSADKSRTFVSVSLTKHEE